MNTHTETDNDAVIGQINQALEEAKLEMQAVLENNRERMREVSEQQKLQQEQYEKLKAEHDAYESKIEEAALIRDREEAKILIQERNLLVPALVEQGKALKLANEALKSVTTVVSQQQERIRTATAEALSLTFKLQATDIQNRILDLIESLNFGAEFESFNKGKSIVDDLNHENAARLEVQNERLDLEIARILQSVEDAPIEAELDKLQAKIDSGEVKLDPSAKISSLSGLDDLDLESLPGSDLGIGVEPLDDPDEDGSLLTPDDRAFLDGIDNTLEGLKLKEE